MLLQSNTQTFFKYVQTTAFGLKLKKKQCSQTGDIIIKVISKFFAYIYRLQGINQIFLIYPIAHSPYRTTLSKRVFHSFHFQFVLYPILPIFATLMCTLWITHYIRNLFCFYELVLTHSKSPIDENGKHSHFSEETT